MIEGVQLEILCKGRLRRHFHHHLCDFLAASSCDIRPSEGNEAPEEPAVSPGLLILAPFTLLSCKSRSRSRCMPCLSPSPSLFPCPKTVSTDSEALSWRSFLAFLSSTGLASGNLRAETIHASHRIPHLLKLLRFPGPVPGFLWTSYKELYHSLFTIKTD